MATQNNIEQQILDLLVTKNFQPAMKDKNGQDARETSDAKLFSFDYVGDSGKNYGTMVIVLDQDNDLKVMYGDNLGRTMAGDDKDNFFDFIMQINQIANRNRWTHTATDLNKLKYVQQGLAAIQEGLFEGYYGTRKISYTGEPTEARLMIKHNHVLGENDKRYRYVESLYIETADLERFKLGFKNLAGGHAMLEHVRQGGKPYDIRGNHITEMVNEIGVLSRFNRASQGRVMEGVTAELITEAQAYYKSLRENLKRLASSRGYTKYFESWHPAAITQQEGLVEDIKTLFIEQTLDARIEAALPVLARLQQGKAMKEAEIFENWANRLTEGTWQLPDTPEAKNKLAMLLSQELPVGADALDVQEQLYDILGDDQLFDQLEALAQEDPNADARDVIRARMEEMGLEVPGTEPSQPVDDAESDQESQEPRAPVSEGSGCNMTAEGEHCPEHGLMECGGMMEGMLDNPGEQDSPVAQAIIRRILMQRTDLLAKYGPEKVGAAVDEVADFVGDVEEIGSSDVSGWVRHVEQMLGNMGEGIDEDMSRRGFLRGLGAAALAGAAGAASAGGYVPGQPNDWKYNMGVKKPGADNAPTSSGPAASPAQSAGAASSPSAASKAAAERAMAAAEKIRYSNPKFNQEYERIENTYQQTKSVVYNNKIPYSKNPDLAKRQHAESMKILMAADKEFAEKTNALINQYGRLKEQDMVEANDDPINYNAAITGSYYEGKEDPLARIKSLALRK